MGVQLDVRQPLLLGPHEGEAISDRPERTVRALVDHELVDMTWSRYEPGERGPDAHVHREHADAFYVLRGELLFELGPDAKKICAKAGVLVVIPQNVIHSFGNESPETTTFLNIHAPGCGFIESLRARRDGRPEDAEAFDSFDPPAGGGRSTDEIVVSAADEGDELTLGENRIVFKAGGATGDGTFMFAESSLVPGFAGPPPHIHHRHLDSFFVLDGLLTVRLGDEEVEAGPGSYASVPPGNVHTFANRGDEPVRVLYLMAPGGFEELIKAVARGEQPEGFDYHPVA